jgi:hypothetical protein
LAAGREQGKVQARLWAQSLEDEIYLPQIVTLRRIAVDREDLIPWMHAFASGVGLRANGQHKTLVSDHTDFPTIVVLIRARRGKKESVRII